MLLNIPAAVSIPMFSKLQITNRKSLCDSQFTQGKKLNFVIPKLRFNITPERETKKLNNPI